MQGVGMLPDSREKASRFLVTDGSAGVRWGPVSSYQNFKPPPIQVPISAGSKFMQPNITGTATKLSDSLRCLGILCNLWIHWFAFLDHLQKLNQLNDSSFDSLLGFLGILGDS